MINSESLFELITELCRSVLAASGVEDEAAVRKLRSESFDVLLKNTSTPHNEDNDENCDVVSAIYAHLFSIRLRTKKQPDEQQQYDELEKEVDAMLREAYFTDGFGRNALAFLYAIAPKHYDDQKLVPHQPELLVPAGFTLFGNFMNNDYFTNTLLNVTDRLEAGPIYFQPIRDVYDINNPYLPKSFVRGKREYLEELNFTTNLKAENKTVSDECTFTGLTSQLYSKCLRINTQGFDLFPKHDIDLNGTESISEEDAPPSEDVTLVAHKKEANFDIAWNWEHLGNDEVVRPKPFATEINVGLFLDCLHDASIDVPYKVNLIDLKTFMKDLKLLTVGNRTNTFSCDEKGIFSMKEKLTVDGLLPATTKFCAQDFIECGSCYKSLQSLISKCDSKPKPNGFMFKALCGAIDEYLLIFKQAVFGKNDEHIMAFHRRMKSNMKLLINLTHTLGVYPNSENESNIPVGSHLLGHLYSAIMNLTEKNYVALLMFVLKRCCQVYFSYLQKWIFCGILEDPYKEMFISYADHYRRNTKFFYDRAYHIRREAVPGFFIKHHQQVLMCGKYTMLLKSHKPTHPLFKLAHPQIPVCITVDEITALEIESNAYYEKARAICGEPVTVRSIMERRTEERRKFLENVTKRAQENVEKWGNEQLALALANAEKRQKQLDDLAEQLKLAEQEKIRKRRESVINELKYLKEAQQMAEQNDRIVNVNLRKRIEYYQELNDMMDEELLDSSPRTHQIPIVHNQTSPQKSAVENVFVSKLSPKRCNATDNDTTTQSPLKAEPSTEEPSKGDDTKAEKMCEVLEAVKGIRHNATKDETNANLSILSGSNTAAEFSDEISARSLQQAVSDFINSNEPTTQVLTELEMNRQKVMSSSNMSDCMRTMRKVLFNEKASDTSSECMPSAPLTEAQRNKLRVLTEEFGAYQDRGYETVQSDVNRNTLPDQELTELQKNRERIMHRDNISESVPTLPAKREQLTLTLETDRERIKRKILESEFGIIQGTRTAKESNTLSPPNPLEATTPMSITSDTPMTESMLSLSEKSQDLVNGNPSSTTITLPCPTILDVMIPEIKIPDCDDTSATGDYSSRTTANLRIDIQLANSNESAAVHQLPIETASTAKSTPDNARVVVTCHQPFAFDVENSDTTIAETSTSKAIADVDANAECYFLQPYDLSYKHCMQMLETNFECDLRTPYFRPSKRSDQEISNAADKPFRLNSLSVITLTEFLKQSVVIPMRKHLELVNGEVMRMYLVDLCLLDHIRSLRHYFFLMDGEFGALICDSVIGKLENGASPDTLFNYQMLHAILENAIGSSIRSNAKNAANLSFIVSNIPDTFDLCSPNALDSLNLSYRITWPLSLILNPETMDQYANIFRYLLKVRRISWILEDDYKFLKEMVKKHDPEIQLSPQYRHIQQIRHKFYHFVYTLQNHVTANALQASWKTFKDELTHATCIEDIYRRHTIYIKRILFLCMLNRSSGEFFNTIENIFKIVLRFHNNLKKREFKKKATDLFYTHSRYARMQQDEIEFDRCIEFTIYLGNKIVRHGYQAEIGEFINLINHNSYYKEKPSKFATA